MNLYRQFSALACAAAVGLTGWQAAGQTPGRITAARYGDELVLSWSSVAGQTYKIYSTGGFGGVWQEVATEPSMLVADGPVLAYSVTVEAGERLYRVAEVASAGTDGMVWIPSGTCAVGSPLTEVGRDEDEGPAMQVTFSRGFWMGQYEVTQGEFEAVMGSNPSFFNGVQDWPVQGTDYGFDPDRPVEQVTWDDAVAYCAALTAMELAEGRIPAGSVYRLPTEAEWEYASRAGTTTGFSYGDDPEFTLLGDYAWYKDNSDNRTHPVGQKLPNPWGLYDMYGNVWEWCLDWYGEYPGGTVIDPVGPDTGLLRVIRGGTFANKAEWCRSANRATPISRPYDFGLRVVFVPGQP